MRVRESVFETQMRMSVRKSVIESEKTVCVCVWDASKREKIARVKMCECLCLCLCVCVCVCVCVIVCVCVCVCEREREGENIIKINVA